VAAAAGEHDQEQETGAAHAPSVPVTA
jgi:hypothetical protein